MWLLFGFMVQRVLLILVLSLGIILGLGISCCYMTALASVSNIFDKRRGVANGVVVAGYGFGAIVLSEIFEYCQNSNYSISSIFLILSLVYGFMIVICSLLLPKTGVINNIRKEKIQLQAYLKDKGYLAMMIGMFCCSFTGLLIIGNLKSIGLNFALPANIVSMSILFMALGNSSGRVIWGAVF